MPEPIVLLSSFWNLIGDQVAVRYDSPESLIGKAWGDFGDIIPELIVQSMKRAGITAEMVYQAQLQEVGYES